MATTVGTGAVFRPLDELLAKGSAGIAELEQIFCVLLQREEYRRSKKKILVTPTRLGPGEWLAGRTLGVCLPLVKSSAKENGGQFLVVERMQESQLRGQIAQVIITDPSRLIYDHLSLNCFMSNDSHIDSLYDRAQAQAQAQKGAFWQAILDDAELHSFLVDMVCDVLVLAPHPHWWEALRLRWLPRIPERITLTDPRSRVAGFSGGRTQIIRESDFIDPDHLPLVYSKPDLSAPGVSIYSSVPGKKWKAFSGTSMATPHVAGAIALLLSATSIKAKEAGAHRTYLLKDLICGSVEDLGESGQDHRYGFGILNVLRAIDFARERGY